MEKNRVNKYILARLQVDKQNNRGKNSMVDIYYELFDIHTHTHTLSLSPLEIDMNKKSNVSLICESVKLKYKS